MVAKRKLAIIGANESINKLILKAKELGYETHVFAWQCGDVGEKSADYFYPISVDDKVRIAEECERIGVCGVVSVTSDFVVPTVNYVARKLGLPANSEKVDTLARNKYLMREAFRAAGIYVPSYVKVRGECDLQDSLTVKFPVIVKPVDAWSSKGVTRVDKISELKDAVSYAAKESRSGDVIVEEFMDGSEYSAECICQDYQYHCLQITEKRTTGFPHYVETGHVQPAALSDEDVRKIKDVIFVALKALDISNGAAHVEFKILANGQIGIIEIGARMGGDCIGTDLVKLSAGYDYLKMVIDVAVGNRLDMASKSHFAKATVHFVLSEGDYEEYRQAKLADRVYRSSIIDQNFTNEVLNSSDRHGYWIECSRR